MNFYILYVFLSMDSIMMTFSSYIPTFQNTGSSLKHANIIPSDILRIIMGICSSQCLRLVDCERTWSYPRLSRTFLEFAAVNLNETRKLLTKHNYAKINKKNTRTFPHTVWQWSSSAKKKIVFRETKWEILMRFVMHGCKLMANVNLQKYFLSVT